MRGSETTIEVCTINLVRWPLQQKRFAIAFVFGLPFEQEFLSGVAFSIF